MGGDPQQITYDRESIEDEDVLRPDFLDRYVAVCKTAAPFVRFLTEALDLEW